MLPSRLAGEPWPRRPRALPRPLPRAGPYRSGKSFLLNQLLRVGCSEGFGVGHTRATQTKGVWVWGEPSHVSAGGRTVNVSSCRLPYLAPATVLRSPPAPWRLQVVYFDTEGFESTGKADVYDDRVFALAALVSQVGWGGGAARQPAWHVAARTCGTAGSRGRSGAGLRGGARGVAALRAQVLVYNLPEAIRESDLEKLSFAVELSKAFYDSEAQEVRGGRGGGPPARRCDCSSAGAWGQVGPTQGRRLGSADMP